MEAPAGWYPDPLGRFEFRYWDGAAWTDQAARDGQTVVDPLDGSPTSPDADPAQVAGTEGLAVVSIILSLLWLFGLGSIAGIVTGIVARRRIKRSGGARTGSGLALAGIILGIITLGLTVLVGLAIAAFTLGDVSWMSMPFPTP